MAYMDNIEISLTVFVSSLCVILFFNLLRKIIHALPWRVNCWFCNGYCWVKFPERNSWTCTRCEQYNGFTKDGDYNRPLMNKSDSSFTYNNNYKKTPTQNGLCKMCNVNQQLKVAQLANFVPMNERNYDNEIDNYRSQLEKAYKLCSPCKKVLQKKLHKEKEALLGSKVLESRTPEKKVSKKDSNMIKDLIQNLIKFTVVLLLILITIELGKSAISHNNYSKTFKQYKDVVTQTSISLYELMKMKLIQIYPQLDNLTIDLKINLTVNKYNKNLIKYFTNKDVTFDKLTKIAEDSLSGFACLLQLTGHFFNLNKMKHVMMMDLLLTAFVILTVTTKYFYMNEIAVNLIKLFLILGLLKIIRNYEGRPKAIITKLKTPQQRKKNLTKCFDSMIDKDDSTNSIDTDDDVSLTQFGVHNFSDSSNENKTMLNSTVKSGRAFAPSTRESQLNTALFTKSPSINSTLDYSFAKPTFWKYQKCIEDSDSDLDESISSLYIGTPKNTTRDKQGIHNSIFSLRKFTATPKFATPNIVPVSARPVISPSKLGHATSWVAGGYWGSESDRKLFNIEGSRSSSQSSGFESQSSSVNNQRSVFSHPPSRAESLCGEYANSNFDLLSNYGSSLSGRYAGSRINSPVYPQMQYNSHVLIPQPRLASASTNPFAQSMHIPQNKGKNSLFKTPSNFGVASSMPQHNPFLNC